MRHFIGIAFATALFLTPASAVVNLTTASNSGQTTAELLASRKQTGKGSTKGAAHSDAMTKVPDGAKITRTVYSGSDKSEKWICHVYYTTK